MKPNTWCVIYGQPGEESVCGPFYSMTAAYRWSVAAWCTNPRIQVMYAVPVGEER